MIHFYISTPLTLFNFLDVSGCMYKMLNKSKGPAVYVS